MIGLCVFLACVLLLVGGYCFYGRLAERIYGAEANAPMPCETRADGVDYVRLPSWRVFLIQLLNIAGLGPVFGALAGCLFGPVALLWIVLGCIFAGATHDFLAAMMSADNGGENLPETVGRTLGEAARMSMRVLCFVLLLLVGVVFTKGPADMLHSLMSGVPSIWWAVIILFYYFLATVLPIDVIIGKIYPFFGALFLFMAGGMFIMLPFCGHEVLPVLDMGANMHPQGISIWPMLFVTIACGAISGFHATQSPMMVRCLGRRRDMRAVFYGAMVVEGIIALIWATVGLTLREVVTDYVLLPGSAAPQQVEAGQGALSFMELSLSSPATAVKAACTMFLGSLGAVVAVLGVVVLPITSGDTAMRTCRLILAEVFHVDQVSRVKRLALALPIFAGVIVIAHVDFSVIWRYFGWANQALACFTLWSIAVLLRRRGRWHWLATLPALFMTTMCATFIFHAPEGLQWPQGISTALGVAVAAACAACFFVRAKAGLPERN